MMYIQSYTQFTLTFITYTGWGRNSSVSIATRYGLDGPGIESRWWRDFPHPSRPSPGAHPAPCTMGTVSFPGVKRPGRGADHPPTSKRQGHERVGLYLYSPSRPQWPVIGRNLTLYRVIQKSPDTRCFNILLLVSSDFCAAADKPQYNTTLV